MGEEAAPFAQHRHGTLVFIVVLLLVIVLVLSYQIVHLNQQMSIVTARLQATEGRVSSAEARLDYVIPLAENANRWAHWHW